MTTELELIYMIWETVRAGAINQDDDINERLMRAYLSAHRGKHLKRMHNEGLDIPDECFQLIPTVTFTANLGTNTFSARKLPKTIRLNRYNTGLFVMKDGISIPVVNSEEYDLMKYDEINKYKPAIKHLGYNMELRSGTPDDCPCTDAGTDPIRALHDTLVQDLQNGSTTAEVFAILVNPDNAAGYDWTQDAYPFPDEIIEDLINSVNAREFNLFLRMQPDEITDISNDKQSNPQAEM